MTNADVALALHRGTFADMRTRLLLSLCLALGASGCDSDDEHDHDDEHGTDGDTHTEHGTDSDSDTSDADASVAWHAEPPAAATVGEAFEVMFMVNTTGDIHVTEVRVCEGADIAECGLGEMGTYTSISAAMQADGMYMASVTLDPAGEYTLVAFAHIGADPHVSASVSVTAS